MSRILERRAPMSTSEARINANRLNAAHSTGPKTEEGKERSRQNALKHGMTGAGVVLPQADATEVDRRAIAFAQELDATGELGHALARRAALNSVRMERGADQQTAALSERVREAEAGFVPPEGVDADEAARLRTEAGRRAMFDPSKEAELARRYEAAAERGFFRALKELRLMQQQAQVNVPIASDPRTAESMGSFFAMQAAARKEDAEFDAILAELENQLPRRPVNSAQLPPTNGRIDLPISATRPR